jgi:hypothetical protein
LRLHCADAGGFTVRSFILFATIALTACGSTPVASAFDLAQLCDPSAGLPAGSQGPEVISKPAPTYPPDAISDWSEGWAAFEFTIAPDGATKDIVLRDFLGPAGFALSSADRLKSWRYRSAMRNGVAVETYGYNVEVTFVFEDTGAGVRESTNSEFARRYEQARNLIKSDPAGAVKVLGVALHDRLELYEETMASYLMALALISADAKNWHRSLAHIRHAVIGEGKFLDPQVKAGAIDLDVFFEVQNGNYKDAYCTYRRERAAGTALSSQTQQLGEKIGALVTASAPLVIPGEVFADERPALSTEWVHPMLRHKFSFSAIKGALKDFRLRCTATVLDSPVNEETQWTVPPNAGLCTLFVHGDNGASFQLIEED